MTGRLVVVALSLVAATSCGTSGPLGTFGPRLAAAKARWAERGPASYDITVTRSCECTPEMTGPVVVAVRNGRVASRRYAATADTVPSGLAGEFRSVEEMFAFLDTLRTQRLASLEVSYDETTGYPTLVRIDYNAMTADDEIGYRMTSLTAR